MLGIWKSIVPLADLKRDIVYTYISIETTYTPAGEGSGAAAQRIDDAEKLKI